MSTEPPGFVESIEVARAEAGDDAGLLEECATKLQAHNRELKDCVAKLDAEAIKEAMDGFGTDDKKLIVATCSRTKSQLKRCAHHARRTRESARRTRESARRHVCRRAPLRSAGRRPSTASCTTRTCARRCVEIRAATTAGYSTWRSRRQRST